MQLTKWLFLTYLTLTALVIVGIFASFTLIPVRDPKTFYSVYMSNIKSFDPAEINDTTSDDFASGIYECLYNYKWNTEPYELFPQLAADMPIITDGGKTWRIKLRHGIHFYDPEHAVFKNGTGPEVKAKDVIYSWKRVCDYNLASVQYTGIFQGHIVGLDDWYDYTKNTDKDKIDWDKPVEGLRAVSDNEIEIKLTDPYPQLRYNLAHTPTAIVCQAAVIYWKDAYRLHPIGTGPFYLAQHLKEQRIILQANPIYRGRADADGDVQLAEADRLPHIKRFQYDYFQEELPVWMLFNQGLLDTGFIPKETFKVAISPQGNLTPEMEKAGIKLVKHPTAQVSYIGFNMSDPVLGKNKPLRQAMSMAYDRDTFIKDFLNGRGQPAIGPIPPGFPTFEPNQKNPYTQFNLAAAREKLKEAETINGGPIPPLTLELGGDDTSVKQEGEYFVSQMKAIGLTVKFETNTWVRFQEKMDSQSAQLFAVGWVADYPDEQTFLQLFYGKNAGNQGINSAAYKNPEYDALYEKAAIMDPSPERDALYKKMNAMVMEDCPWICEVYPVSFVLYYDWLKDYHIADYGSLGRAHIQLDTDARSHWKKP